MKVNALKYILLSSIAAFFFVGPFGLSHLAMGTSANGNMSGCPFMGIPALCHMNPLEHAFALQNMFATIPFAGIFAFFISLLLTLVGIPLLRNFWRSISASPRSISAPPPIAYAYIPRHTLQEAFSNGILHSKAF